MDTATIEEDETACDYTILQYSLESYELVSTAPVDTIKVFDVVCAVLQVGEAVF